MYNDIFFIIEKHCFVFGHCDKRNIIDIVYNQENVNDCLKACKIMETCSWFTYYQSEISVCILLASCYERDDDTSFTSGHKECQPILTVGTEVHTLDRHTFLNWQLDSYIHP